MNNQEILRKIVNYIENVMKEKSLTSRDLADICVKKNGENVSKNYRQHV